MGWQIIETKTLVSYDLIIEKDPGLYDYGFIHNLFLTFIIIY